MQLIGKILHQLPQPYLDRLIAWRNAYPNTPLKYLPLPVRAEVKHILESALAAPGSTQDTIKHPASPAAGAQPAVTPPATTCLPTGRPNGHATARPANGTPRSAPARTILPVGRQVLNLHTVIGTDVKTGRDIAIPQHAKQQGTYILGVNGT
jgi:hypothetical protein